LLNVPSSHRSDSHYIRRELRFLPTPTALNPHRNIATTFGAEKKLEWSGYLTVKKLEDAFIHLDRLHERD